MTPVTVEKDPLKYHSKRRIFAIIDDTLQIAEENYPKSHDEWFIEEGWMHSVDDPLYEKITRGMRDPSGDIYFYVGSDLLLTKDLEEEFFSHLKELVQKMSVKKGTRIYGGMIKGEKGIQWPCRKDFGVVEDFIAL